MSLRLCRMEPVRHPFEVPELGVRLYSSQELCYVIYENPLLVMDDFVDYRLIQFIRNDLNMEFLAGKLENWKKSGEGPDNLLLLILTECEYYTMAEVNQYRQVLIQLRKKHPAEYGKEKADYLAGKKQYKKAILLYKKLLDMKQDQVVNDSFLCRVWLCLGACQARLFQFEKAYQAYDKAYRYDNENEEVLERIYYLKELAPGLSLAPRYQTSLNEIDCGKWKQKMELARQNGQELDEVKALELLFLKEPAKRMEEAAAMVRKWKQEYRNMV